MKIEKISSLFAMVLGMVFAAKRGRNRASRQLLLLKASKIKQ